MHSRQERRQLLEQLETLDRGQRALQEQMQAVLDALAGQSAQSMQAGIDAILNYTGEIAPLGKEEQ